ncbi:MAG: response regulator [Chloroflexota bacterium]
MQAQNRNKSDTQRNKLQADSTVEQTDDFSPRESARLRAANRAANRHIAMLKVELDDLHKQVNELKTQRTDLEVMLEMTTSHSDIVEEEFYSKAEEAVSKGEQQLRMILEATPAPVLISRVGTGDILYVNAMAGPTLGLANDELLTRSTEDFYAETGQRDLLIAELQEQGEVSGHELQIRRADGVTIWVAVSLRQMTYNDELAVLTTLHDITDLKQSAVTLEATVADLQQVDKLKDEFLANTSHELRTPIHGIIGLAQSMLDGATGSLTDTQQHNLSMIVTSSSHLSNLVNDILDFSRLRQGEIRLRTKPIDLHTIVNVVLELTHAFVEDKPLVLENKIPTHLPPASADEIRLQQILINIIGNGIKFTHEGKVTVDAYVIEQAAISSESSAENAQSGDSEKMITVVVRDTGIGIPSDRFDDIFESFKQIDASTERNYGGAGLGLSISRQLVKLHGGTIQVQSVVGEGSEFTFTLPMSKGKAQPITTIEQGVSKVQGFKKTSNVKPMPVEPLPMDQQMDQQSVPADGTQYTATVLIVDDEPINRQVLMNQLKIHRYKVIQAADGIEALEAVGKERPDLILLDIMMPRLSGYDTCRRLRQTYTPTELPIVMLTAKNQVDNLVEGFNAGANDYLTKPFSRNELLARINSHLRLAQMNRASSRFIPDEFLTFLEKGNITEMRLGDHVSKQMTIMFSDVRSFTTIFESLSPDDGFNFVNTYLGRISPIIRTHAGVIVKYMGDGTMAIFPESADDAVQAGIAKINEVAAYSRQREAEGKPPIHIGIGLHTGHLVAGMIGESHRIQADVLSDHVNLASRVESINKFYDVSFLITEDTYDALQDPSRYAVRYIDRVQVKGKKTPVRIYEVFEGDPPALRALKEDTLPDFAKALDHYYKQEFEMAQSLLFSVLQRNPDDKTAWHHLIRTTQLRHESLPPNWTGVTVMTEK